MSGKARLGILLAMLAMLLAVSVPAAAEHDDGECDFDGDDSVSEEEAEDCADAIEDFTGADVDVVCTADDDDEDGLFDEDGDNDGEDDDEDGEVDEDDDCDPDDLVYILEDVEDLSSGAWWE